MNQLNQNFTINYAFNVFFTEHLFAPTNTLLKDFLTAHINPNFNQKILFVIDEGVWQSHPSLDAAIRTYFQTIAGISLVESFVRVHGGEVAKNDPTQLSAIIEAIDQHGVDRHSYIVGLGGGAVLDLVGYAAAIAHRGVRHIRIPTTVLSQDDSGIGVKNGINYQGKKNFLGTFVPPVAVFNDYTFLKTLDFRSWISGVSEAVKVALIKDIDFFEWIVDHAEALAHRSDDAIQHLIFKCADLHMEHIRSGDPFEFGSSRPLDFGHWSAHKLEQITNFEVLHGEAVAIGIAIDVVYSYFIGALSLADCQRVLDLLLQLGLPIFHEALLGPQEQNPLLLGLKEFQEHLGGRLTIVLLAALGKGKEHYEMDHALILQAINQLARYAATKEISL